MDALPAPFKAGLANCMWPGRCQIIRNLHLNTASPAAASDSKTDSKQSTAAAAAAAGSGGASSDADPSLGWSDRVTFYLDGAHTDASILVCLDWFKQIARAGI